MASGIAAVINFPLWKASAIAQSGFQTEAKAGFVAKYLETMLPPYKGVLAVIGGMAWARGAIFYGSDSGKQLLLDRGVGVAAATVLPPLVISSLVQVVNQPLVRATITVQNPATPYASAAAAMRGIAKEKGVLKLWHGTSAGIVKTVPKYMTAIACRDAMDAWLPRPSDRPATPREELTRSAVKSVAAGVCGAALTNPLDVLRNEMFKTDLGVKDAFQKLLREEGAAKFATRGMGKNLMAVAIPIAITIFVTDALVSAKKARREAE
jgi:hypothetical protein